MMRAEQDLSLVSDDISNLGFLDFGDEDAREDLTPPASTGPCHRPPEAFDRGRSQSVLCPNELPLRPNLRLLDPEAVLASLGCSIIDDDDRAVLDCLIANGIEADRKVPGGAIFYSRDRNHYSRRFLPDRYVPDFYAYAEMMRGVAWLDHAGLIVHRRTAPSSIAKHRSRIRASPDLLVACENVEIVSRPKEVIILKDRDGYPTPYGDSRDVDRMRRDVWAQNEVIQSLRIGISDACIERDAFGRLYRILYGPGSLCRPLRRIFNGGWTLGGRWYGPTWQNLPAKVRAHLLIDGELVIEVDFKTCHPRLLCALAGIDLPFHDEGFDYYDRLPGLLRKHVKRAFNILINAPSDQAAVMALAQELRTVGQPPPVRYAQFLVDEVRQGLPGLQRAWRPGIGLHLQYRDAEICARVQRKLRRRGVPLLSVHDSFIVPQRHEGLLKQVMNDEMEVECGRIARC